MAVDQVQARLPKRSRSPEKTKAKPKVAKPDAGSAREEFFEEQMDATTMLAQQISKLPGLQKQPSFQVGVVIMAKRRTLETAKLYGA